MDRLIYTAMTGAKHVFMQQAGTAHNLANASTIGFKSQEHRFRAVQARRSHLEHVIGERGLDLTFRTEKTSRPHVLVCTKNMASYHAALKKYREDLEHLATVRAFEAALPK